jgi:hypothetical protein
LWESAVLFRLGRLQISLTEFKQAKSYFDQAVLAKKAVGDRKGEAAA